MAFASSLALLEWDRPGNWMTGAESGWSLLALLAAIVFESFALLVARFRLEVKGYRSPDFRIWSYVWIALGFVAGMTLPGYAHHVGSHRLLAVGALAVAVPVLVAVVALLAAALLPRRRRRTAGTRVYRQRYKIGGVLLISLGLGSCASRFVGGPDFESTGMKLCFAASAALFYIDRRLRAPGADEVLATDPRPPVLFLRSFAEEAYPFGNTFNLRWRPKDASGKPLPPDDKPRPRLTFDYYLAPTLAADLGPLVALGNPEDDIPPDGASRTYAADREWREHFVALARESRCILLEVSHSGNLQWELAWLRTHGLCEKLFVLTPPLKVYRSRAGRIVGRLFGRIPAALIRLERRVKEQPAPTWASFARGIERAGLHLDPRQPPFGALVAFDAQARSRTIACQAVAPEDYVRALAAELGQPRGPARKPARASPGAAGRRADGDPAPPAG